MTTRILSLALLALTLAGCRPDAQDPSVTAATSLQRSLDMDSVLDLLGPGGPVTGDRLPAALACDDSPEVIAASVCGHDLVREAHFAWTDCRIDHPGDRPDPKVSGSLDLTRDAVADADCGAVTITDAATFAVTLELGADRRAEMTGSLDAVSTRELAADTFTRDVELAATRTMYLGDDAAHSVDLHGSLRITATLGDDGPVRTVDGTLNLLRGDDDDTTTIALRGVVHNPQSDCAWPTAGELVRSTPEGDAVTLSFGPTCGAANLDGEPVDLSTAERGPGRHGRPF